MPEPSAQVLATYATVAGVIAVGAGLLVERHTGVGLAVLTSALLSVAFGIIMDPALRWIRSSTQRRRHGRGLIR